MARLRSRPPLPRRHDRCLPPSYATPADIAASAASYVQLTDILGITRNENKDGQGTAVTVLGYETDTVQFVMRLNTEKLDKARRLVASALADSSMSLSAAEQLAGFLCFCAPAIQLDWVFLRHVWSFVASFPSRLSRAFRRRIPAALTADLTWWDTLLPLANGMRFFDDGKRPRFHLWTDASGYGIGGFWYHGGIRNWRPYARTLPPEHAFAEYTLALPTGKLPDINVFEVAAVKAALHRFAHIWAHGTLVRLHRQCHDESGPRPPNPSRKGECTSPQPPHHGCRPRRPTRAALDPRRHKRLSRRLVPL